MIPYLYLPYWMALQAREPTLTMFRLQELILYLLGTPYQNPSTKKNHSRQNFVSEFPAEGCRYDAQNDDAFAVIVFFFLTGSFVAFIRWMIRKLEPTVR